ncbi:MAG: hypothetical protein HY901_18535 [Deltaproteobacteria bacterium]|nr:hypothetical protein [Deltaproteobacteria bacterium]
MLSCLLIAALAAAAPGSGATKSTAAKKPPATKAAPAERPTTPEPTVSPSAAVPQPLQPAAAPEPAPSPASTSSLLRLAVLDPTQGGDVPARPLAAFSQALLTELRKVERVSVIGMSEVREMIAYEKNRQLLNCGEQDCLAEIGGALGVDELVSTNVSLVASTYTFTMKRMNTRRGKIVQSSNRTFDKRDGEEVLAVVGPMVEELFPDRHLKPGRTRGVDKEVIRRLNPPPLPRWVFATTAALAVGCAAGGGVAGYMMTSSAADYRNRTTNSVTSVVSGSELKALENRANAEGTAATALLASAGGLAVVAVIEALFTDWHDDRAAIAPQPVIVPGGAGAAVSFSF